MPLVLLLIVLVFLGNVPAHGASLASGLTPDQLQWVVAHPVVRAATMDNLPPYSFYEGDQARGMSVDYFEWAMDQLGIRVDWVEPVSTWVELRRLVQERKVDVIPAAMSLNDDPSDLLSTHAVLEAALAIVVRNDVDHVRTLDDLKGERVALVRYSAVSEFLQDALPKDVRKIEYPDVASALQAVSRGEADASVALLHSATYAIQEKSIPGLKFSGVEPRTAHFAIAVRPDLPVLRDMLNQALENKTDSLDASIAHRWIHVSYEKSCTWQWFAWGFLFVLLTFGVIAYFFWRANGALRDEVVRRTLTEERLARNQREMSSFLNIMDANAYFTRTDPEGQITYVSSAYCQFLGWTHAELLGHTFKMIRHPDTPENVYQDMWRTLHDGQTWVGELRNRKRNGDTFWVHLIIAPIFENGVVTEYQATMHDITARKRLESMSVTDELTGLFNRRHFNEVYPRELRRARREGTTLLIAIMDVDNFKKYNDNYGHVQGDFVLQSIGELLTRLLRRPSDFAFRLGGEEFGILASGHSLDDAKTFLDGVLKGIRELRIAHSHNPEGVVTASVGSLLLHRPDPGLERQYYQRADTLLYRAKVEGRNHVDLAPGEQYGETQNM